MEKLRITLAQLNATLGDFKGNLKKAKVAVEIAEQREVTWFCFLNFFYQVIHRKTSCLRYLF